MAYHVVCHCLLLFSADHVLWVRCCRSIWGSRLQFNFTSPFDLKYCTSESDEVGHIPHDSCGKVGGQCRCRYRDAVDAVFPVTGGNPFFIATRCGTHSWH